MKTNMYTMLLLAFFAGSSLTVLADSGANAWTGDGDGWRWEDPDNWEYDHVPSQYDSVVISGDAYVQVTELDAECATITIFDDATLFVRPEGSLYIHGYFYDVAPETSGIGYYYPPDGIHASYNSTIVNWGEIYIGDEYFISPEPSSNGYYGPRIYDGIHLEEGASMLNRGVLSIEYVGGDGIEMDDDALFVNRDEVTINYVEDEGIDMDGDAIIRNRGTLDISYTRYQGIDQDDSDTEFINHGILNISFTDNEEGIELDDGLFRNTETGVVNIGFVANDLLYIRSGADFENYGEVNLNVTPFFPEGADFPEIVASAPEDPETEEDAPDVASIEEFTYGAILITGGDLHNYSEINISPLQILGSPETPEEAPYYNTFASLLNVGGELYNEDCASINIEGPFPIINDYDLYNMGTIDLSFGDIPFSPQEGPGPQFGEHINSGYFYNDGDILSDYPFFIGPNPIDEEWTKSSIGDQGENDNFSLGCDITITTSSRQGHRATTDNLAFLNQTLCGDGMLTARIDGISNGAAGIMIRDGEGGGNNGGPANVPSVASPKAFMIASRDADVIYHGTRYNEGGQLTYTPFFTPHDRWLRVERIGNYIRAYHSTDGNSWSLFHQVYLQLGECAQIGLFATSQNGAPAMAAFSHVEISGSEQYFSVPDVPTAETPAIHQRATVWPTPVQSQFTVEFEQATQVAGTAILRNELGQAIGQRKLEPGTWQLQWDANTLPGGLYLLEVQTEDGYREVLKVLKQ